jgi:hypothetical protein
METYSKSSKGLREMISASRGESRGIDKSLGDRTNMPSRKLNYGKSKKTFANQDPSDPFGDIDTITKKHTRAIRESTGAAMGTTTLPDIYNETESIQNLRIKVEEQKKELHETTSKC